MIKLNKADSRRIPPKFDKFTTELIRDEKVSPRGLASYLIHHGAFMLAGEGGYDAAVAELCAATDYFIKLRDEEEAGRVEAEAIEEMVFANRRTDS